MSLAHFWQQKVSGLTISGLTHLENQATYCGLLRQDNLFAAKVLFVVNAMIQNLFKDYQQGIFSTAPLDFSNMQEDVIKNRSLNARLPLSLMKPKKRREQEDYDEPGCYRNGDRGAWVYNNRINPEWKIEE